MKTVLRILFLVSIALPAKGDDGCSAFAPAIERAMSVSGVPALAIAVVQGDRVVCSRAFGFRDLEHELPATTQTEFYIASASKPFIALAAKLVELDGKLDLDAPLDRTLPELKLPAPLDPSRMSLRDLLTHRLGFDNDAAIWRTAFSGEWTKEKLLDVMAKDSVVTPRQFRYSNLGYNLTGLALGRATESDWQSVVTQRVLVPAGMRGTFTRASEMNDREVATPYGPVASGWIAATPKSDATMQPAGGFYSTIGDLGRWVQVHLQDGIVDGTRVFPARAMRDVHAPQIDLDRKFGRIHRHSYALGWYHGEYDGDLLLHHFGSYPGAWAHTSFMPERKIGVAAVSNAETPLPDSVALYIYDVLLQKPGAEKRLEDDAAYVKNGLAKMPGQIAEMRKKLADSATDSDRALASYAGTYTNDAWGTIVVKEEGAELHATAGLLSTTLDRVRGDAFLAQWLPGAAPERIVFTKDGLTKDEVAFVKTAPPSQRSAGVPPADGAGVPPAGGGQ